MRGPESLQAESLLQRQSLEQQIAVLKVRCESLRQHNDELKIKRAKGEKDTHEFVAYFQKELEKKDDRIADYREQLTQLKLRHSQTIEEMKTSYERKLGKLEEESSTTVERLQMRLKIAEDELTMLNEFKEIKEIVEQKLLAKEKELEAHKDHHELTIQQLERKFLEEKRKMKQEQEKRIAEIKRLAREEAQKGLDSDTRKIVTDNRRMAHELRFQLQTTEELQREKRIVEEDNKKLKREVVLNVEKEQLYAKRGTSFNREKRELQAKIESLERSLSQVVRDFEKERETAEVSTRQQIEELVLNNGGLKQLLRLKNKELTNIRQLAQVILDQRTEVEQYFLDALEQVKDEIRKKREDEYKVAVSEYRNAMRRATQSKNVKFPAIRAPSQFLSNNSEMSPHPSAPSVASTRNNISSVSLSRNNRSSLESALRPPDGPNKRVDLRDLSWEDRERVLRLLFAKINNVQSQVEKLNQQQSHANARDGGNFEDGFVGPEEDGMQTNEAGLSKDSLAALRGKPISLDMFEPRGEGAMQYSRGQQVGVRVDDMEDGGKNLDETFVVTGIGQQAALV